MHIIFTYIFNFHVHFEYILIYNILTHLYRLFTFLSCSCFLANNLITLEIVHMQATGRGRPTNTNRKTVIL